MLAIRRVCAWCGESEDSALDFDIPTTHGLCPRCFTARMALAVPGARQRYYERAEVSDTDRIAVDPDECRKKR